MELIEQRLRVVEQNVFGANPPPESAPAVVDSLNDLTHKFSTAQPDAAKLLARFAAVEAEIQNFVQNSSADSKRLLLAAQTPSVNAIAANLATLKSLEQYIEPIPIGDLSAFSARVNGQGAALDELSTKIHAFHDNLELFVELYNRMTTEMSRQFCEWSADLAQWERLVDAAAARQAKA